MSLEGLSHTGGILLANAARALPARFARDGKTPPSFFWGQHSSVSPVAIAGDISSLPHGPDESREQLPSDEPHSLQVRAALAPAALPRCELQGNGDFGIQLHHRHYG